MSLKTRIQLLVLTVLIAGIWGLAVRTATVMQADIEKLLSDQMTSTVGYVASEIDAKLQVRIALLSEIAATVTPDILADPAGLRRLLEQRNLSRTVFPLGVFIANRTGTMIADFPTMAGRVGSSIGHLEYFRTVMSGGKPVVASPLMGRFIKKVTMPIAVPIRDASGNVWGVLAGAVFPSDDSLFGQLEVTRIGQTGTYLVVSPKDHLIVSATEKTRIMQPLPAKGVNSLLDRRVEEGYEAAGVTTNSLGINVLNVSRKINTTGWIVIAGVPTAEVFAPIATSQRQIYGVALLISLAIALALYFVLKRQLAPIEIAGLRIQRMTSGEEPLAPLPVARRDEIGRLAENFNQLIAERIKLEQSLRNEIVERERAESLLKANEELMRSAFEQAAVGIVHIDPATCRILMANEKCCQLLGYSQNETVGTDFRTLTPADDVAACEADRAKLIAGELEIATGERRLLTKNRGLLWVQLSLSLLRDKRGQPRNFVALIEEISARKQADEARARLAAVAEGSNDAIYIRDEDGLIVYWNDGAEHIYGYTSAEVVGRDSSFLVPPELLEERRQNKNRLMQGETVSNHETVRIRKDGNRLDVSVSVSLVRDHAGKILGMATIARDISERKQAEKTRAYLAAIVDSSHDAIVSRGLDRNILSWNRAAELLFGYAADEVIGRSISLIIPPDREGEARRNRESLAQASYVSDLETVRLAKGGRRINVSMTQSPINNERGEMVGVALIFRDIRERIAKTALMHLLESLARATNEATTPEVAMQACLERICTYGNWPLGHVAMYAPGNSAGVAPISYWRCEDPGRFAEFMDFSDRFSHDVPSGQFVGASMRERRPVWIEDLTGAKNFGRLSSGTKYGIRAGFVFPVIVGDEVAGFLEFFATEARARDEQFLEAIDSVASQLARLIERSRAAANLARLNTALESRVAERTAELEAANKQLASFSYTVAHDLRTPLRAINGFSALVLESNADKLGEASIGHLKRIHSGSVRMGELIDDLLDLTRLSRQEIRRHHINISELTAKVVASLTEAFPDRTVAVTIKPHMHAYADAGLMRIVLENLIGNAWKFTAKTGAPAIDVGAEQRDGHTTFYVRDNGAGFDMEYAHKLFAPFQRLHHAREFDGTGIGLATVKNIIQRHGGDIWLESAVDHGTTAFFTIGESA